MSDATRDPAEVKDEEYEDFYKAVSKDDSAQTLGWAHFKVSQVIGFALWEPRLQAIG